MSTTPQRASDSTPWWRSFRDSEVYGWIELHLQKNYMTHQGEWFKASYKLTEEGRDALAHERGRG